MPRTACARRPGALFPLCLVCLLAGPVATWAQSPHDDDHADDPAHAGHVHDDALDELVVTYSGHERRRFDVIQGTTVLDNDELAQALSPTIGDTLSGATGVRSTGFTPGATRPIVRGLDGPRLRILQNHTGVLDASVSSPDHQVAVDPLLAERVEVLKGAGTLRYGSNAVGGIVNVIDGRIAERPLDAPLEGAIASHYGTNQDDRNIAGAIRTGAGPLVFHAEGFARRSHDLEVKGDALRAGSPFAGDDDDPLFGASGRVPNTFADSHGGVLGASLVGEDHFLGVAYQRLESLYGVPVAHEEHDDHGGGHDDEEEDESISIDLVQNRIDIGGGLRGDFGPFSGFEFRGVYGDYRHTELEGDARGTRFFNRGYELRLDATQTEFGGLDGQVGVQWRHEDRDAVGEEAFLPKFESDQWALFTVQELHLGALTLEGGLRVEHTSFDVDDARRDPDFTTWSASVGGSYAVDEDTSLGLSLSRTERPPVGDELYANGPHFATASFERGSDSLDSETAWGVELSAKRRQGAVTGGVNFYWTHFEDFLFQRDTGEIEDDLPVRQVVQDDARFFGAEVELAWTAARTRVGDLVFDAGYDFVRGESDGDDLPRIPSQRLTLGAGLEADAYALRVEAVFVDDQNRVARAESKTDGHTLLNAEVTWSPSEEHDLAVFLQGRNLTDQRGHNHTSFLKDRLPIAGRDVRVGVRFRF